MTIDLHGAHLGTSADASFRHRMGLRRLETGQWLELRHPTVEHQRDEKARLMADFGSDLLVVLPEAESIGAELQLEIAEEHRRQDLAAPRFDGSLHPLDAAARTIREDLCVHAMVDDELVLVGGSVCFPTRWTLSEKIGRTLDLIHRPVPGYAEDVSDRVNTFVSRLGVGAGVWRRNWSIMPSGELCLPGRHDHVRLPGDPARLWLRTERQTLRRLSASGAVVFTIAVDVEPLPRLLGTDLARELAAAIEQLPPPFATYKGLDQHGSAIARYLRG